jgi:hypothetical protein
MTSLSLGPHYRAPSGEVKKSHGTRSAKSQAEAIDQTDSERFASHTLFHSIFCTTMSLYDLHDATLNDMEGEGFAYSEKTVYGKAYKGVFFGEDEEEIEVLSDAEDDATFEGILYDRSREREKSFSVEVTDVVSTPSGERADFVATEKP